MRLTKPQQKRWRFYIRKLRELHPVRVPVVVRTRERKMNCGDCLHHYDGFKRLERITIYVMSGQAFCHRVETLIHEWAHAVEHSHFDMFDETKHEQHSVTWGTHYAKIYTTIEKLWGECVKRNYVSLTERKL